MLEMRQRALCFESNDPNLRMPMATLESHLADVHSGASRSPHSEVHGRQMRVQAPAAARGLRSKGGTRWPWARGVAVGRGGEARHARTH